VHTHQLDTTYSQLVATFATGKNLLDDTAARAAVTEVID
jgi:hypothetical protein